MTMVDFLLEWADNHGDLAIQSADLAVDTTLRTAVVVSLFTDALVTDDELPDGETDRRGWWGQDAQQQEETGIGSKLWTLERSKRTDETLELYRDYSEEALQWLVDDGHVLSIQVTASYPKPDAVQLDILLRLPHQEQIEFQFTA